MTWSIFKADDVIESIRNLFLGYSLSLPIYNKIDNMEKDLNPYKYMI